MERHETTTEAATRPSRTLRPLLLRSAGWLAVASMLALSSPGVGVEQVDEGPPVAPRALAPRVR